MPKQLNSEAKIISLLKQSDAVSQPRKRWVRKWLPARGTKSKIKAGKFTLYINKTDDYYALSWGNDPNIRFQCYLDFNKSDGLRITEVGKTVTTPNPGKNVTGGGRNDYDFYNEQDHPQRFLCDKTIEFIGL